MFQVATFAGAVGCLVGGLICLGLWPSVWALVERRGRLPSHTFADYGLSYTVITITACVVLGQTGPAPGPRDAMHPAHGGPAPLQFWDSLVTADARLAALAMAGGALIAAADVMLQYGVAFLGVAVGPPAFCALSLLASAAAAYFLDGRRNAPALLFPGVAAAVVAIGLGVATHAVGRAARRGRAEAAAAAEAAACGDAEAGGGAGGDEILVVAVELSSAGTSNGTPTAAAGATDGSGSGSGSDDGSSAGGGGGGAAAARLQRNDSRAPLRGAGAQDSAGDGSAAAAVGAAAAQPGNSSAGSCPLDSALPHPTHRILNTPPPGAAPPASPPASLPPSPPLGAAAPAPVAASLAQTEPATGLRQRRNQPARPPGGHEYEDTSGHVAKRAVQAANSLSTKTALTGFMLVIPGALCNSASYVLFVIAVRDALHLLPPDAPPLNVYTAAALFALGFGATAFSVAVYAMYRPPLGTARSSLRAWAGDWRGRALCVLSGALASGGDLLQFMGGDAAGYAAALLVQAHPLVGMLIGTLVLRELRGAGWRAAALAAAQAGAYAGSVALLAASAA